MPLRQRLENPTVIAAVVAGLTTLLVTGETIVSSMINAYYQRISDGERMRLENRRAVLLEAAKQYKRPDETVRFLSILG